MTASAPKIVNAIIQSSLIDDTHTYSKLIIKIVCYH
jgi:hypothetical protein